MEKRIIVVLLVVWIVIAAVVTGFLFYFLGGGAKPAWLPRWSGIHFSVSGPVVESYSGRFDPSGIDQISIDCTTADIRVTESDTGEIGVIVKTLDDEDAKKSITVSNENGILFIAQENANIIVHTGNEIIEIAIPADYDKGICFASSTGDMEFSGDFRFAKASFDSSTGDFTAHSLIVPEVKISGTTGDVNIQSLEAEHFTIERTTGDITIEDIRGSGGLHSSVGDICAEIYLLTGDLDLSCTTGDITLDIAADVGAKLDLKTSAGEIESSFPLYYSGKNKHNAGGQIGQGAVHNVTASTSVGDIELYEAA